MTKIFYEVFHQTRLIIETEEVGHGNRRGWSTSHFPLEGLYQFKRLPFGLQASSPNFQRLMNFFLKGQLWTEFLCYPDDILVYGESFEEHNIRVNHVLALLSTTGLTLNPDNTVLERGISSFSDIESTRRECVLI